MKQFVFLLLVFSITEIKAADKLVEITFGQVWSPKENFYETGLDYEYFPAKSRQFSIGLASEVEFEKEKEFFTGPLLSLYLNHYKIFMTSGLQGHDAFWRIKTRIGLGYDIHINKDYLLIPNFTLDYIDQETHPGVNLGIARNF